MIAAPPKEMGQFYLAISLVFAVSAALQSIRTVREKIVVAAVFAIAGFILVTWSGCSHAGDATLSFTLPATLAKGDGRTVTDCANGGEVHSLAGWRVFAQVQSRTWRDSGSVMERSPAAWARLWPSVRAEAIPQQVRSASTKAMPRGGAGQRVALTVPDSLNGSPVLAWYVTTFNDSLLESCPTNLKIGGSR